MGVRARGRDGPSGRGQGGQLNQAQRSGISVEVGLSGLRGASGCRVAGIQEEGVGGFTLSGARPVRGSPNRRHGCVRNPRIRNGPDNESILS